MKSISEGSLFINVLLFFLLTFGSFHSFCSTLYIEDRESKEIYLKVANYKVFRMKEDVNV